MPLLAFFASNPDAVALLNIEQVVSNAGDGVLKDQSVCAQELREYVRQVPTTTIAAYVEHCLSSSFSKSGMVLQDLVNELGRRLDYDVTNGRYQGVTGAVGFDGLWQSPENHALVVEVKTTDAYRIALDNVAGYRTKLIEQGQITPASSILIVVGREDTGELEAQIRGSRHAWDMRVISAEALIKLVLLKEGSEAPETGLKIRSLLTPVEYTRLDRMIDVMFTTVTDVEVTPETELDDASPVASGGATGATTVAKSGWQFTDVGTLNAKRERIVAAIGAREQAPLVRKSRALYWSGAHDVRVACGMSKRYQGKNQPPYWYAFHPQWNEFLGQADRSFFVLGCMDVDVAFAVPHAKFVELLPMLHTTTKENGTYWHVHLTDKGGSMQIVVPKKAGGFPLGPYQIAVPAS